MSITPQHILDFTPHLNTLPLFSFFFARHIQQLKSSALSLEDSFTSLIATSSFVPLIHISTSTMTTSAGPSVPPAFHQLLATHTPAQITAMVAAVQQPHNVPTTTSPSPAESSTSNKRRSGPSNSQPRKKAKTSKSDISKVVTRPLNSWMAFRSELTLQ